MDQSGLGLPDRDYYFRDDSKSVDIRKQYLAHVARMFELTGESSERAVVSAQVVLDMETVLAKGSLEMVLYYDFSDQISQDDSW